MTEAPVPLALAAGNVAVITGGASGIGLAAAQRFLAVGLKVRIADRAGLDEARGAQGKVLIVENRPALPRWHPDFTDAFAKYRPEI